MAKKPRGTPKQPLPVQPDAVESLLIEFTTRIVSDFFFDPDNEAAYQERYPSRRAPPSDVPGPVRGGPPLAEDTIEMDDGDLDWRLEATVNRNGLRMTLRHPKFSAVIEGVWQFQREAFRHVQIISKTGTRKAIMETVEALLDDIEGPEMTEEEMQDLLAMLSEESDPPLIGDDPEEPPPATAAERTRLLSLVAQRARKPDQPMRMEDRTWLEMTPQALPALTDLTVEAMSAAPRDENRIGACLELLTALLEFVRYRQDRGWDWADQMLKDYQQRLISLGQAETLEQTDWFALAAALTEAKVPVSDDVQSALAEAGMTITNPGPPEEMMATLRSLTDEMATMVDSPFDMIEALNSAGAVMPAALRSFMATELSLSPHAVLREAVPLMLLDADSSVRRSAAAAMEQVAGGETVSPDWLRRAITVRNWIPQADRPDLDRAIRKARAAGVPIAAWPGFPGEAARSGRQRAAPFGDLAFHASMVDGSGAQSIIAVSRTGRKGLIAGLLLKHGIGVADAWLDTAATRSNINGMLREIQGALPTDEVNRTYVDIAVQHAIAAGVARGAVPGERLLQIAECTGSAEWKDRGLNVQAESALMFAALDPADRTPAALAATMDRITDWMSRQSVAASWFEDHQDVHQVIAKVPRKDNAAARALVLTDILPGRRAAWAERFLLMALWCDAAAQAAHRRLGRDFVVLTHELTGTAPLQTIPVMIMIAEQTVLAARTRSW